MGWDWWLPPNYSQHGREIDLLWNWVFWLTSVVGIAVIVALAWFCVKYRHRGSSVKGIFTHGNTRLEMIWTLIPAVLLLTISALSKRVWDNFRYNPAKDADTAKILVIGQQFKWNTIYAGPDKKLGRYLMYPKTTDLKWPDNPPGDDSPYIFPAGEPGPAYLPEKRAREILKDYIETKNPLGKDFSDPDGLDDDWKSALARPVYLPQGRPVEIDLSSRDVIHDFFAPNFRAKLDAVPGTKGQIFFTAVGPTSAQLEAPSRQARSIEELRKLITAPKAPNYRLVVSDEVPMPEGVKQEETDEGRRYFKETVKTSSSGKKTKKKETIAYEKAISPEMLQDLQDAGFTSVMAYIPQSFDLVCEQLCGSQHYTMKGDIVVVTQQEYTKRFETKQEAAAAPEAAPAAPAPVSAAAR